MDELAGILDSQGPEFLETYRVRGLTWEEVKELKGPELVGLGMGEGPAPGTYSHCMMASGALHHGRRSISRLCAL